jgi:tetratricopeptide (TPR) repeat protein
MIRLLVFLRCLCLLAAGLVLSGCLPGESSHLDEQREAHFLAGRSKVNSQNYLGAIEQFEKALEVNPRSAAAHFELAWLNEEQKKDYAAAIYHYQQHLRLNPNSEYADRARERIRACKIDLARTEVLSPIIQGLERDLRRSESANEKLKREIETLNAQLAAKAAAAPPAHTSTAQLPIRPAPVTTPQTVTPPVDTGFRMPPQRTRQHVVRKGETVFSIATQYGLRQEAVLAANPGIDPHRIKVGDRLNIPER